MERILVVGAAGFLGKHVVRRLLEAGTEPALGVRSMDRLPLGWERLNQACFDVTDAEAVREAFRRLRPRLVLNLAGVLRPAAALARVNVLGVVQLVEAALEVGVERLVLLGSAEEYGDLPIPFDEEMPPRPVSLYGVSKAAATRFALAAAEPDFNVVVLRPFTVYGPGQPAEMFVAQAIAAAVRDAEFRMTAGQQKRDFVYVDDLVEALLRAVSKPGLGSRIINIGSGIASPLAEVATLVWRLSGSKGQLLIGARHAKTEELFDTCASTQLARDLLGWRAAVELCAGLQRTLDWARVSS